MCLLLKTVVTGSASEVYIRMLCVEFFDQDFVCGSGSCNAIVCTSSQLSMSFALFMIFRYIYYCAIYT